VLRRELSSPKEGVRLLLRPELAPEVDHLERLERWLPSSKLPPCRLVWIGDLVDWDGWLHVAALVGRLVSHEEAFKAVLLAVKWLGNASVARLLSELPEYGSSEPSGMYGEPGPNPHFAEDQWRIDLWFGPPDMVTVTAEEIPALAIATLGGHPRFASSPLCVVADRSALRLVVVPAWEIFRFYYAQSERVTWSAFAFPTWGPSTLGNLLEGFDGHRFAPDRRRSSWPAVPGEVVPSTGPLGYAAERLVAIGRDTVVSYARTGRAHIRALPPFRGAARLLAVAVLAQLGEFAALFVQQILTSVPGEGAPGVILWKKEPDRAHGHRSSGRRRPRAADGTTASGGWP
jgi:hypothetical protein